ncbi:MAG TPA: phosphoserine phosphatase SerB [Rhizomicrobium sp.]|nr:phosphoserine phosphatase SerB [Rhizomicrobium sp.]
MPETFPFVLNVVSPDADELAGPMRAAAAEHGAAGEIAWLSNERVFDIPFGGDPVFVREGARLAARHVAADINVVASANRRKKLLVADMDSTIIGCECLDELADEAGLKPRIAEITERAMRGEILFEPALRERVGLLKGLPLSALEATYKRAVKLNPGAKALVATMKANGAYTLLVSGGFTFFTSRVAREAGFHEEQANVLLDDGATLTGKVREPILGRQAKLEALKAAIAKLHLTADDALAVGDGANDLAMIQYAGLGVAYHAKPIVAEAASTCIDHGDLRGLLYLQGYRYEEIVNQ